MGVDTKMRTGTIMAALIGHLNKDNDDCLFIGESPVRTNINWLCHFHNPYWNLLPETYYYFLSLFYLWPKHFVKICCNRFFCVSSTTFSKIKNYFSTIVESNTDSSHNFLKNWYVVFDTNLDYFWFQIWIIF